MKTFAIGILAFTAGVLTGIFFVGGCLSTEMLNGNVYVRGLNFPKKGKETC